MLESKLAVIEKQLLDLQQKYKSLSESTKQGTQENKDKTGETAGLKVWEYLRMGSINSNNDMKITIAPDGRPKVNEEKVSLDLSLSVKKPFSWT